MARREAGLASPNRAKLGRVVLWFLVASLTTGVILFGGYPALTDWHSRLAADLISAAILFVWLALAAQNSSLLPSTRLMPAITACLIAFGVSTLTSTDVRLSAEMLGYALLLMLFYILLVRMMTDGFWRARFSALVIVLTLTIGTLYVMATLLSWIPWWGLVGRIALPPLRPANGGLAYGSPNIVAAVLLVTGATACALIGGATHARRRFVAGLLLSLSVCVAITGSRGAWLGAAAGLAATVAVWSVKGSNRQRLAALAGSVPTRLRLTVATMALPVGFLAFLAVRSRLTLEDHGLRQTFFDVSLAMFQSAPLTGLGPGTWPVKRAVFTPSTAVDFWNPHAQSLYLQTLAEFGGIGIVAGIVVLACLMWLVRDAVRSSTPERRRLGYATLFLLTAIAVQQTVDFFANIPALLAAVAVPVAWLDATSSEPPWAGVQRRIRPPSRLVALVAAGSVILITAGLWRVETVAATAQTAVAVGESGAWNAAVGPLKDVVAADPDVPLYWFELGLAAANSQQHDLAREAFAHSAAVDGYAVAWIDLAGEDLAVADASNARAHLDQGERLGWQNAAAMVSAAALRYRLGDRTLAVHDAGYALQAAPTLAADTAGWGKVLPGISQREIVDSAIAQLDRRRAAYGDLSADTTRGAIAVFASRTDLAIAATEYLRRDGLPSELAEVPAIAEAAWAGDHAAVGTLQMIARDHPTDNQAISYLALIADKVGDTSASARYRLQALTNSPFAVGRAWKLSITEWKPAAALLEPPTGQYASAYRRHPLAYATTRELPGLEQQ